MINDIFKLTENKYDLQNFHIFQTEIPRWLKYGLDAIPYRASQLWQQVSINIREAASLALFKIGLKLRNVKIVHVDLAEYLFKMSGISD